MDLTVDNCGEYLARRGQAPPGRLEIRELGGGVSNRVLLVEGDGVRFVLKQSLDRLRVADEWLADRSRIFREARSLQDAARLLPAGAVPQVLWVDEPNFLFAMTAVPPSATSWKTQLLAGEACPSTAATVGTLLGLWIRESWGNREFEERYGDQTAFDQLRIDPYYRTAARRRPEVAARVGELIAASAARRVSLVHGDWSPKNFLVGGGAVTAIDFEVVHYGDPTFDAAFCINHFLLKCFRRPAQAPALLDLARVFYAWAESLLPPAALGFFEPATVQHLGCLMLARIDGKSPVEYIVEEDLQEAVRRTATRIILERPDSLERCYTWVSEEVARR
ncbi:MAG TPA: aminoglycoside phosphotransferase family protein [Bryobacterales bacterium]|nr:aminoglycoside phosphotransferase family protein [Bryobacterales bacterium]